MSIKLFLVSLFMLLIALKSNASGPFALKTWQDVSLALQANGVMSHQVDWGAINKMCQIHRNTPVKLNSCRFNKALAQKQFQQDTQLCTDSTKIVLPDYLAKEREISVLGIDEDGKEHRVTINMPVLDKNELNKLRKLQEKECIRLMAWKSSNDWQRGRAY